MRKDIYVEIVGQRYTIRSDLEEDYVQRIADYVNERVKEVLQTTKTVDTLNAVILTALNIANDFFRIRNEREEVERWIEDKSGRLLGIIDSQVGDGFFG